MSKIKTEEENAPSPQTSGNSERRPLMAADRPPFPGKAGRLILLIGSPPAALILAFLIYTHNPNLGGRYYLPCVFHALTGLYCPGCGNTRALYALLHLDFKGAVDNNALFPVLAALLIWFLAGEYLKLLFGRRILWIPKKISPVLLALFVLLVIAFTILRNIPVFPFSYLAPGT